ncbi:MAG TPA: hypothetical protein HPQ04_03340 [Rhodospirillaceae bacterium]|nr:hypothetical protein [Rhodospirillaceae bacterium]
MTHSGKAIARLNSATTEMSSSMVTLRRSMMVFRSQIQTLAAGIAQIGDCLGRVEANLTEASRDAAQTLQMSRDAVGLCDRMMAGGTAAENESGGAP